MSLLRTVCAHLEERNLLVTVIGAYALAAHGIARATQDIDLLVVEAGVLRSEFWSEMDPDVEINIRRGDSEDPLRGVVHFGQGESEVELIVGKQTWMSPIMERRMTLEVAARPFTS